MAKRGAFLTLESRIRILVLKEEGYSGSQIAARVGCNRRTVTRILQKFKKTGDIRHRKRSGRPRKSTVRQDRVLRRVSLSNRKLTSPELLREWKDACSVNVCTSTVRRRCLSFGLKGCKARKKPLLTVEQRKKRMAWGKKYGKWTVADWVKVIFSDESTFCLFNDHLVSVRRFKGEEFKPECCNLSMKNPMKVMV